MAIWFLNPYAKAMLGRPMPRNPVAATTGPILNLRSASAIWQPVHTSTMRTTDGTSYILSILCTQSNKKNRNCDHTTRQRESTEFLTKKKSRLHRADGLRSRHKAGGRTGMALRNPMADRLRHSKFAGLREDKDAKSVVKETGTKPGR